MKRKKSRKSENLKIPIRLEKTRRELLIMLPSKAIPKTQFRQIYDKIVESTQVHDWRIVFLNEAFGSIQNYEEDKPLVPILLEGEDLKKLFVLVKNTITDEATKTRLLRSLQDLEQPVWT